MHVHEHRGEQFRNALQGLRVSSYAVAVERLWLWVLHGWPWWPGDEWFPGPLTVQPHNGSHAQTQEHSRYCCKSRCMLDADSQTSSSTRLYGASSSHVICMTTDKLISDRVGGLPSLKVCLHHCSDFAECPPADVELDTTQAHRETYLKIDSKRQPSHGRLRDRRHFQTEIMTARQRFRNFLHGCSSRV